MGYEFNAEKVTKDLIVWVRKFYADFDLDKKAVLGISGRLLSFLSLSLP